MNTTSPNPPERKSGKISGLSISEQAFLRHAMLHPNGKPYGKKATTKKLIDHGLVERRKFRRAGKIMVFVNVTPAGKQALVNASRLET